MSKRYKLMVTVPITHADAVRTALGQAGAGKAGNYAFCSFSVRGVGRFMPLDGANPFLGQIGQIETVEEEQIQVDVWESDLPNIIQAMKNAHPYEEVAYEVYAMVEVDK